SGWITRLEQLERLVPLAADRDFAVAWRSVKRENKLRLSETMQRQYRRRGAPLHVEPDSMFDVQVKRIHEYKRQLLNVLHVITLYNRIKDAPHADVLPRTVIFGGKAAPSYAMAKLIIRLINGVGDVVNGDPALRGRLSVVFLADYKASLAEQIIPAADLSEQISTAGTEASGTGNMKFALNGALTIGTLDGANIEIRDEVGPDNFFLFGLTAQQVLELQRAGYRPREYYEQNAGLKAVLDLISSGFFEPDHPELFRPLIQSLLDQDTYML